MLPYLADQRTTERRPAGVAGLVMSRELLPE